MEDFASVVQRHMAARGWSLRQTARNAGYSDHTFLSRVLNGQRKATPYLALRLDGALGADGAVIAAAEAEREGPRPGAAEPAAVSVRKSAEDATALVMAADAQAIDPVAIDQAWDDVTRMLAAYTSAPGADRRVLEDATALRRAVAGLAGPWRRASQASDLHLLAGVLSGICSYASLDLGYPAAAAAQARAAFLMGDLAGHDGLRAWSCGTLALIARFEDRYADSLAHIERGLPYAAGGTSMVRLLCGRGQTLAHIGDAEGAVRYLALARDARDQATADLASGIFTFSPAKQAYYSGSSLQWLEGSRNARAAEAGSLEAIRLFRAAGPGRALADELLAHVYLGNSRLTLGEVDGTMEALRPVLDLPPEQRSAWHAKRMQQIAARLASGGLGRSRLAITAREEITAFTVDAG